MTTNRSDARGVLLVAPEGAAWVAAAAAVLGDHGYAVAKLTNLYVIGLLMHSGGVGAVMLDARSLDVGASARISELRRRHPGIVVVVVGEPTGPSIKRALEGGGTVYVSWPFTAEELTQIFPGFSETPGPGPSR